VFPAQEAGKGTHYSSDFGGNESNVSAASRISRFLSMQQTSPTPGRIAGLRHFRSTTPAPGSKMQAIPIQIG
jgi:hypothetical protein